MSSTERRPSTARSMVQALWFPAFFVVGFMIFYLLPFHAAKPNDLPVSVVGQQAASSLGGALEQQTPGGFDVSAVPDAGAARQSVLDRDVVASYVPGDRTLFVAGADGRQLSQITEAVFGPVAEAGGGTLAVVDVAPAAAADVLGTSLFYVTMAWNIAGYIVVMMLMSAVDLTRRQKLHAIVGFGAAATLVAWLFALSLNAIGSNPAVLLIGFLLTQAVGWTTFGMAPFVRRALPGVAMGLFVLLSIPSSGGALPKEMVPGIFQALHYVFPLGNAIDAARDLMYFGADGLLRPVLVLLAWLALGVGLVALAVRRERAAGSADELVEDDPVPADAREYAFDGVAVGGGYVPPAGITGHVLDPAGRPVAGATVTVTDMTGRQLDGATVDHSGRFTVAELGDGLVTLVVSGPGHLPVVDRAQLDGGGPARQYRLVPAAVTVRAPAAVTAAGSAAF